MKQSGKLVLSLVLVALASGCSFVKLTRGGENVAVLQMNEVGNCEQLNSTTVSVLSKVVVNRSPQKVATELRTLARNHAAERGGDTIVATSAVANGEQSFNIYRCRR